MLDPASSAIKPPIADDGPVAALIALGRTRRRIVALTGAGMSTESGIPDYRGPGGVWEQKRPPTIGDFLENPATREEYWRQRFTNYPELAAKEPNAGHVALAELERRGLLLAIVTQNIDGLHQRAGNSPERVIELHGSAHRVRCLQCHRLFDGMAVYQRQLAGETVPACQVCGGPLRSATVLFGESLPPDALAAALRVVKACDLLLVVGSSLVVNPAARLPEIAKRGGAAVAIVNRTPTALDPLADVHVLAEAGATLTALTAAIVPDLS